MLTEDEGSELSQPFSMEELEEAIDNCDGTNAPDRMGSTLTSSKVFGILSRWMSGEWFKNFLIIAACHTDLLPISWH